MFLARKDEILYSVLIYGENYLCDKMNTTQPIYIKLSPNDHHVILSMLNIFNAYIHITCEVIA